MNRRISHIFAPLYLMALVIAPCTVMSGAAVADTLKGGVLQTDHLNNGPSLKRNDIGRGDTDPFGGGGKEEGGAMLTAPPGAFDSDPFGGKPLKGNAENEDGPFGSGAVPTLEPDSPNNAMNVNNNAPFQQGTTTPGDSDKSAQMKLLWDAWHKRVAETIYTRFNQSAQMFFKRSQPLSCQVSYMVARDGRIGNVRVLQASANPIYDTMLVTVIKSIQHNPVLEYPPNSKRQFVEKSGTFTWNYSGNQGFRYLQGDQERIQQGKGK
ncbi:MAG: TonB C-terminal domain-containing protein [Cyanobacteria bacterium SZAS TMP-1]|nr:TonB C-terminal domain-containing protein [Cyanobacteria bacterium SZAS TMP-1]